MIVYYLVIIRLRYSTIPDNQVLMVYTILVVVQIDYISSLSWKKCNQYRGYSSPLHVSSISFVVCRLFLLAYRKKYRRPPPGFLVTYHNLVTYANFSTPSLIFSYHCMVYHSSFFSFFRKLIILIYSLNYHHLGMKETTLGELFLLFGMLSELMSRCCERSQTPRPHYFHFEVH